MLYIYVYGNMDPINIPHMLAYIPAPWYGFVKSGALFDPIPSTPQPVTIIVPIA